MGYKRYACCSERRNPMRDPLPPPQATAASTRTQQARAFVRSRLVQFQNGPVCSCHPNGGHPTDEPEGRDTVQLRRQVS
jgi:hypothetical protein